MFNLLSPNVVILAQLFPGVATLAQLFPGVATLAQLFPGVATLAQPSLAPVLLSKARIENFDLSLVRPSTCVNSLSRYLGAAHGHAGILHMLLHFRLKEEDLNDVKEAIKYMVRNRFRRSGNYPSSEGNKRDQLVQWSHRAGGIAIMLCKTAQVFSDDPEFRAAAIEAGEVVWNRGLNSRMGLSDGISGNAYAFLSLYRLTKDEVYLERAKAFSEFLYHNAAKLIACSEMYSSNGSGCSLFHGLSGVACLWLDLVDPENAKFRGFEV